MPRPTAGEVGAVPGRDEGIRQFRQQGCERDPVGGERVATGLRVSAPLSCAQLSGPCSRLLPCQQIPEPLVDRVELASPEELDPGLGALGLYPISQQLQALGDALVAGATSVSFGL